MTYTMVIADDEFLSRKSQELFIRKEFPDIEIVGMAEDGIELKQMLEECKPDMAMVDICMPGLSGIEVIELLQHRACNTHFIINTAYSDFEYAKKALNLKTDGYLLKPAKREESIELIERLKKVINRERENAEKEGYLERALEVVNPILGSTVLLSLFLDDCAEEDFNIYCKLNKITFDYGCVSTFVPVSNTDKLPGKNINRSLNGILGNVCTYLSTMTEQGLVIMYFVPGDVELEKKREWCEELTAFLSKQLKEQLHLDFEYGVGNVYRSFAQMRNSYLDSIQKFPVKKNIEKKIRDESACKIENYVNRAKGYIFNNYRRDISLNDCAEAVGISSYYLSHIFKNSTGCTFVEYLSNIRIEHAKKLALGTSLSVREIAEQCGYSNVTYFGKVFKRFTGMTVGEYRSEE